MMTQDNVIRLAGTLAACALLILVQSLLNRGRLLRVRQYPIPLLSLVYAIAGTIVLSTHYGWSEELISRFPLLENGNIVLWNLLLLAGFLPLKLIALPIASAIWKREWVMEVTAAFWYEFDQAHSVWCLRKQWADHRGILRTIWLIAAGLSAVLPAITWMAGSGSPWWAVWFPCAFSLVAGEVYFFLNGKLLEEFSHEVSGTNADGRSVRNYYKLRELYEKLFEGRVLASHTGCEFARSTGATGLLAEMAASEDPIERQAAEFFRGYDENQAYDNDRIRATVQLLRGRSVVILNPFYRDQDAYLTLPIVNTLLNGRSCLIICGRSSTARDARDWMEETLRRYSRVRSLWRVQELGFGLPDCEVGILSFRQLYDVDVLAANREFFALAGFVLLLEPSVMVNTGQVGISIISEFANSYNGPPVYCICDRGTDGLVDTMSHLLKTEITHVVAPPVPRSIYTGMAWDANGDFRREELFDKQTRYLGNGVELAAVAVKHQVETVSWYSERKVPLKDLRWIAGQHYATICRYMNIPVHQKSLYEKLRFIPNLWCSADSRDSFLIVEDEFCNFFNTMRAFLCRGTGHSFVNVLSEDYLLRDYMRCNQQMFLSNPNAIPSYVPDYAKTERNTVLKLLVEMAVAPIPEPKLLNELLLVGCQVEDVFDTFSQLMRKYTFADGSVLEVRSVTENDSSLSSHRVNLYSIDRANYDLYFARTLKNAYYIVEEEQREREYIDAKMFGHVPQTILPGQFVTYFGKYYQVRIVSPTNGIILRRASDLYDGRRSYRQIRTYHFTDTNWSDVRYSRVVMDVETAVICCDFSVTTSGYLDMGDSKDLRMARIVCYDGDPRADDYTRRYRSKNVLRLRLPDTDQRVRFTLCLLLGEAFRTLFPEAWQYLAVLTSRPDDIHGMLNYLVYAADGNLEDDYIYLIEDSDIDLGLLDAVQRSFPQIMEILADFIDWHFEKMREPERTDPVPEKFKKTEAEKKRRNLFLRMADYIRKLFAKKVEEPKLADPDKVEREAVKEAEQTKEEQETDTPAAEEDYQLDRGSGETKEPATQPKPGAEDGGPGGELELIPEGESASAVLTDAKTLQPDRDGAQPNPKESESGESCPEDELESDSEDNADLVHIDGTDIFEEAGMPEDNLWLHESFRAAGIEPILRTRYQTECYLKFGFDEIDERLRIEDVQKYLHVRGFCNNRLTRARHSSGQMEKLEFDPENHCDFCGVPLSGVSYELLNDGRVRCNECSASAIATVEEFTELFYRVLELMQMFFDVSYQVPIQVKCLDARKVAKGSGYVFRPSTQLAVRALGYAQRKRGTYSIVMENGSPRLAAISTMVHELTHIWQYLNWKDSEVRSAYGMSNPSCTAKARDLVYEGMAVWASIQYLYQIGESYYASIQEKIALSRMDVYGFGFRLYNDQYPLVRDLSVIQYSPYKEFPPVDPDKVKALVRATCTKDPCVC